MKRIFCAALAAALAMTLGGCKNAAVPASGGSYASAVRLTVWADEEDGALLERIISGFKEEYAAEAELKITVNARGETECRDALLSAPKSGADVFIFADEDINALAAAGILAPAAKSAESLPLASEAASVGGRAYAYPLTADKGYFLYYNKAYLSDEDVKSLDSILRTAAENNKFFTMNWRSAQCVYSFFGCTGLKVGLNRDGTTNYCNWNSTDGDIGGADVLRSMTNAVESGGFQSGGDEALLAGAADGSVIAGISGIWLSESLEEIWGEKLGAAKLPEYSCGEKQVQMASVCGGRLVGVNAYSGEPEWSARLAEWITNEENQLLRFETLGQFPANAAAAAEAARLSPAAAALAEQTDFSRLLRVGENFEEPVRNTALCIAAENPPGADPQIMTDVMVKYITAR